MQISPSVYFYSPQMEGSSNTIIIDGQEKLIIDPGFKHHWPSLVKQISRDRIEPGDLKLVLHTHSHPDHMEAGEILEADYEAVQAMSPEEKDFFDGYGRNFFSWMALDFPRGHIGRLIPAGRLDLGDKILDLHLTPGHTPGSLCVHWPEAGVLCTGDLIFANGFGRTDFPGGSAADLYESVERMSKLQGVRTLLSGHGPALTGAERVAEAFRRVLRILGG
jgi:glyoxylase-like metal-dependent hydrolase (beta-lactamase superfamily II)